MSKKVIDLGLFSPVFEAIGCLLEKQDRAIVAIDGPSSSGKTMLAGLINERYDCNVFHMDDFFLQDHQRRAKRLDEAGGNIDYERFLYELASKIRVQNDFSYQIFDCELNKLTDFVDVTPNRLNIIEGVYSSHPLWNDMLDLKVFLTVDKAQQQQRIL
ncbi:MAG TPA: hypothetical protein VFD33_01740, partial [Bacillota bacterium]|nr:hypothetical protein [Bacillota bacterium]